MSGQQGESIIIAEYLRRKDAGEDVDVESICKVYPKMADELRSYIAGEAMFEGAPNLSSQFADSKLFSETINPHSNRNSDPSKSGLMFGRYRIERQLGQGAMGTVYLAVDTKNNTQVALKIPLCSMLERAGFRERFKREAVSAAKLSHTNICKVYEFDSHDGTPYIAMQYIDGHPLSRFVGTTQYLDQRQVAETVRDIADALEHAHQNNVIHRDMKPGNILVDKQGTLFVTDFGLARKLEQSDASRMTQDGTLLGTPAYMPPEQMAGEQSKVGSRSDVYSLGVVLYELLAGQIPFQGSMGDIIVKVSRDMPPRPSSLRDNVDEELEKLCLQMMAKKPSDRVESMRAVSEKLTVWLDASSPEAIAIAEKTKIRVQKYEKAKQKIIEQLKQGQFAKATKAMEKMSQAKGASIAEYVAWAKKELPEAKKMPEKFQKGIPILIEMSKELIGKYDYQQAVTILEQIPEDYRSDVAKSLLHQAQELQEESDLLLMDLKNAVRKKSYNLIKENLKRYLEIKPNSRFAMGIWEALKTYKDIPERERKYQFDEKGKLTPFLEDKLAPQLMKIIIAGVVIFAATLWYTISYLNSTSPSQENEQPENSIVQNDQVENPGNQSLSTPSLLIAPFSKKQADTKQAEWATYLKEESTITNSIGMKFNLIPPGEFQMGRTKTPDELAKQFETKAEYFDQEIPHKVRITKPYYLGTTEVTQKQWKSLMGTEPWKGKENVKEGDDFPATYVSWEDAQKFISKLNQKEGANYRLPTEAEWEYACQAGSESMYCFGDSLETLKSYASFDKNARDLNEKYAHRVGLKLPNSFGLFDVHGNVWEWCADWYGANYYKSSPLTDPQDLIGDQKHRVLRGGSWDRISRGTRSSNRNRVSPTNQSDNVGFRLVKNSLVSETQTPKPIEKDQTLSTPSLLNAPFSKQQAEMSQIEWAKHLKSKATTTNSVGMKFNLIPPGEFNMGHTKTSEDQGEEFDDETPHTVRITKPYYLGTTEVTQKQWKSVMGTEPWKGEEHVKEGDNFPATYVSWEDGQKFIEKLNQKEGANYRLPTEAEWEYACRAGSDSRFCFGDNLETLKSYAWFGLNAWDVNEKYAHRVGLKLPNNFGLFDVHGNVWEWCSDWYGEDYYNKSPMADPKGAGPESGNRVIRGGGWNYKLKISPNGDRHSYLPKVRGYGIGFRLAKNSSTTDV